MVQITKQQIAALAPNGTAAANGKKISDKGGFVKLFKSKDDTFYMGECTGSGKSNYITSADFIDPQAPVFRCSCPSRQFPCKHSLALLYEIEAGKHFEEQEIPEDILEKRAKKEAREAKVGHHFKEASKESGEQKEKAKKTNSKSAAAAKIKKIKKQMEGLSLTESLITDLLRSGLGTMRGTSLKNYKELAKQLGDYYLPGPQMWLNRLVLTMEACQKASLYKKESEEARAYYREAADILVRLHSMTKKAKDYLAKRLETEDLEDDDSVLYEELGGIWQLDRLNQLGLCKENARLAQLSFQVYLDEARKEYVDLGYWMDVDTGEIVTTKNYRPVKALKYVKQDDTVFDMLNIPLLTYYPGEQNRRVRWENASFEPLEEGIFAKLKANSSGDLSVLVKEIKNQIKNTLAQDFTAASIRFSRIGKIGEELVLEDDKGNRILLKDQRGVEGTVDRLSMLPEPEALKDQALFGAFYYDEGSRRICLQPYSIITDAHVIRLLY